MLAYVVFLYGTVRLVLIYWDISIVLSIEAIQKLKRQYQLLLIHII